MRPQIALILALASVGCASTKSADADDGAPLSRDSTGMPFIKLANRKLGLVVHWVGKAPAGATEEAVERQVARRLKTTYREPLFQFERAGEFAGIDPSLYVDLVDKGVDDAIILEAGADTSEGKSPITGRIRIITLTDERTILDASLAPKEASKDPSRFADHVWMVIAKNWTDPGAGVPLDAMRIADRLAQRGACREAVALYDRLRADRRKPHTVAEAQSLDESRHRLTKCANDIALEEAMKKDRLAVFDVELSAKNIAPDIRAALETEIGSPDVRKTFRALTDKPVVIEASPEAIIVVLRYHPEIYAKMTSADPKYIMNQRALSFEPYVPAMTALALIRDRAADKLPTYDAPMVKKLTTVLRLTKFPDDRVEIDFADLDGRIVLGSTLHVKVGAHSETTAETVAKKVLRDHVFVLGPPHEVSGELTNFGLVYQFFELE